MPDGRRSITRQVRRNPPRRPILAAGRRARIRFTCNEYFTPMTEPPLDETDAPDSRRGALIGLGIVLALIVVGLLVTHALRNTARVQDCVMSGRTNCAPIDTSSSESHGSN
jgi:hypothetical protein